MIINKKYLNQSKNKKIREKTDKIKYLIIHHTAGTFNSDIKIFKGDTPKVVSIHYYITKSGEIFQFISDNYISYHTGETDLIDEKTSWGYNLNPISIGIELENYGDGVDPYPSIQIDSLIQLSKKLILKYNIPIKNVLGHKEITTRKIDPSSNFFVGDMEGFRNNIKQKLKYDNIIGFNLFSDLNDNYEIKRLIEIGLYRFTNNITKGKLLLR